MTKSGDLETEPSRRGAAGGRVSRLGMLCAALWMVAGSARAQGGQSAQDLAAGGLRAAVSNPSSGRTRRAPAVVSVSQWSWEVPR